MTPPTAPPPAPAAASKHVRVAGDLADKLSEVSWFRRETMADLLDPLIREAVERWYEEIPENLRRPAPNPATA